MSTMPLTIWCNARFGPEASALLKEGVRPHRLVYSSQMSASNLVSAPPDEALATADVAFGQPDPQAVMQSPQLRWAHLTSAGYTRYDTEAFRDGLAARGAMLTNSSQVYADPCAQHVLAFMMAQARQLPQSLDTQRTDRGWPAAERRLHSRLLSGQKAVILGFGAIGRRLVELLAPFEMEITAVRRRPSAVDGVKVVDETQVERVLGEADHVVSILPDNPETRGYCDAGRFAAMKPGCVFYNIGRGTTVDQEALLSALQSGPLAAAYLDVTDPEPLPAAHPLWGQPNCFITPHTAGGFAGEEAALVRHFLRNLERFTAGEPLRDRVM